MVRLFHSIMTVKLGVGIFRNGKVHKRMYLSDTLDRDLPADCHFPSMLPPTGMSDFYKTVLTDTVTKQNRIVWTDLMAVSQTQSLNQGRRNKRVTLVGISMLALAQRVH